MVAEPTTMDEPVVKNDKLISRFKNHEEKEEGGGGDDDDTADDEQCDAEVWDKLSLSFRQAQLVLDQNRVLIQQVNENHQSKIPDNLVKNVALIGQINATAAAGYHGLCRGRQGLEDLQ
ncbi:protein ELF4-LIKE 1-like [Prosopis cineraria]|uniref:protein ELF4-LIKE 1-like n=1 Tax=Prosopis cineraria TaxID=364024 RepID=UPI00240FA4ED|nr:protein ELF4-LIKE 1-like [Prosopis cineraria]